jgi:hypothetical protein
MAVLTMRPSVHEAPPRVDAAVELRLPGARGARDHAAAVEDDDVRELVEEVALLGYSPPLAVDARWASSASSSTAGSVSSRTRHGSSSGSVAGVVDASAAGYRGQVSRPSRP